MKHVALSIVLAMALGLSAAAQSATQDRQSPPQGTNPSAQTTPSGSPDMSNQDQGKEKKMKGCIESEGGKYMLREKNGKSVELTGSQEIASHVGHQVTVHGTLAGGSDTSAGAAASSGGQFSVTKIDMVSDTCKDKASKNSDHDKGDKPSPYHF